MVGIYWIAGVAYFLNQNVPSLQNVSLEEIVRDNILLNIIYGQIQFLNFTAKVNLIFNIGRSLNLWNIVRSSSLTFWYKMRSRLATFSPSQSQQNNKVASNEDPLSPTPEPKNADADVPPQPPPPTQPYDINGNNADASPQPSQSNNIDINNADTPSPSPSSQSNSTDANNADPTPPSYPQPNTVDANIATNDNPDKELNTPSGSSAVRSFYIFRIHILCHYIFFAVFLNWFDYIFVQRQFLFYLYLSLAIINFWVCVAISASPVGFLIAFLIFFLILYILKVLSGDVKRAASENNPEDYKVFKILKQVYHF